MVTIKFSISLLPMPWQTANKEKHIAERMYSSSQITLVQILTEFAKTGDY